MLEIPMGTVGPTTRLTELDALRGLAALGVVLFHFTTDFNSLFPQSPRVPFSIAVGEYGVLLFFAISGFVILLTLSQTKRTSDFMVARFARLFPAFWVSLMVTSLFILLFPIGHVSPSIIQFIANLTMVPVAFGVKAIDTSYWTLAVELLFYAVMILLWRLRWLPYVERVLLGWILVRWVAAFLPVYGSQITDASVTAYIPFFAIGVACYRIWQKERRWIEQAPLLAAALATVFAFEQLEASLVWLIVLASITLVMTGKLKWIRSQILLWLGQISYPLYLVHSAIGTTVMVKLSEAGVRIEIALALALIFVILLAALVSAFVERPALRIIRAAWRRKAQHNPPSQARISC
jgi:peptidoglycan/LPS O-acetylase OafA/YrhL